MVNVFAVPIFFICMRECLETSIIVSVLLSFLKQALGEHDTKTHKQLVRQVWFGVGLGLAICLVVGAGMIGAFYGLGKEYFSKTEDLWEGVFGLIATVIITLMGAALLRVSKLQDKWKVKLSKALEARDHRADPAATRMKQWAEKYAMFILPFVTVLREGLEAVVFIGGVGLGLPAESIPLAVVCGLAAGCLIGYLIYRGGLETSLQYFLVVSTCLLYLVAAGLFSKAVWSFQQHHWVQLTGGDAAETGSGPGSYDIRQSVWHVNCCNPEVNGGGGWGIFNAILGWQNSATYGSVISYNLYWLTVILAFGVMRYTEQNGHLPFLAPSPLQYDTGSGSSREGSQEYGNGSWSKRASAIFSKSKSDEEASPTEAVREIRI